MDIPARQITASINIDQIISEAHSTAKEKGWHDPGMEKTFGDDIALITSELSEALEDFRGGYKPKEIYYEKYAIPEKWVDKIEGFLPHSLSGPFRLLVALKDPKPCGIPIELADAIIRIADVCGKHGIDLDTAIKMKLEYNKTRSHRHGNKAL